MHPWSRRLRLSVAGLVVPVILLVSGACARNLPEVTPDEIPALEQQLSGSPDDAELQTRLGIAYYKADRHPEAQSTLAAALEDGAESGAVHFYLGLSHEELENWAEAREAYSIYLDADPSGPLVEDIQARLTFLVHRELQAEAQRALAQEDELSDEPPEPRSVAVFPYRLVSGGQELQPLTVALADMIITDLSLAGDLTVLERTKIQTLLDEMALSEAGYTEASTGARAGRILQAEHVVQGALSAIGTENLEMSTQIRETVQRQTAGQFTGEEPLQRLFDLEKQTVFRVLEALGVQLTPAEREAINENRTESIQAFLAYGRGLQAMDRGDYSEASQQFNQAIEIDPGFDRAQNQGQEVNQLDQADNTSTDQLAQQAPPSSTTSSSQPTGSSQPTQSTDNLLQQTANQTNPNQAQNYTNQGNPDSGTDQQSTTRNPTQEARNSDQVSSPPQAIITIQISPPSSDSGGGEGDR